MQDELLNQVNDLNKTVIEKDEEISIFIVYYSQQYRNNVYWKTEKKD